MDLTLSCGRQAFNHRHTLPLGLAQLSLHECSGLILSSAKESRGEGLMVFEFELLETKYGLSLGPGWVTSAERTVNISQSGQSFLLPLRLWVYLMRGHGPSSSSACSSLCLTRCPSSLVRRLGSEADESGWGTIHQANEQTSLPPTGTLFPTPDSMLMA